MTEWCARSMTCPLCRSTIPCNKCNDSGSYIAYVKVRCTPPLTHTKRADFYESNGDYRILNIKLKVMRILEIEIDNERRIIRPIVTEGDGGDAYMIDIQSQRL
jgi:hypothetical protein